MSHVWLKKDENGMGVRETPVEESTSEEVQRWKESFRRIERSPSFHEEGKRRARQWPPWDEVGEAGRDQIMEVLINLIMWVDVLSQRQQAGYNRQVAWLGSGWQCGEWVGPSAERIQRDLLVYCSSNWKEVICSLDLGGVWGNFKSFLVMGTL